jgi:hypothetical protein
MFLPFDLHTGRPMLTDKSFPRETNIDGGMSYVVDSLVTARV